MSVVIFWIVIGSYLAFAARARENAILGAAVLAPFNQYHWIANSGIPFVNGQNVIVIAALFAALRSTKDASSRPAIPWVYFAFLAVLTFAWGKNFLYPVHPTYAFAWEPWQVFLTYKGNVFALLMAIIGFLGANNPRVIKRLLIACCIGFGAELAFCFLELIVKTGKVTGHMQSKNASGAFLAVYAAVALGVYLAGHGFTRRWVFLALCVAGSAASIGTRSRGGVLALGMALLLATLLRNRVLAIVLLLVAVSYQQWMPPRVLERFESAFVSSDDGGVGLGDTAADRVEIWKAGLRTIPDYPLGIGLERYKVTVPRYGLETWMRNPVKNAHNQFVLAVVEYGILGLFVLFLLLRRQLLDGWFVGRKDPDPFARACGFGSFVGLVAMSGACLALTVMFRMDIAGILWLMLGVTSRRAAELRAAGAVEVPRRRRGRPSRPRARRHASFGTLRAVSIRAS